MDIADIRAAAARLHGVANRTPLLESTPVNEAVGGRLLLKAESLQRTGSFKFRGAYNKISQAAGSASPPAAIVAYSSGNHAQGVAAAARMFGIPATIVMPSDAPETKKRRVRALGATIREYERHAEDRKAISEALARETGALIVPPYDDADIIAGQGTVGLEIHEQADDLGVEIDHVTVCCGGGGLTAGVATALAALRPGITLHVAEPEGYDDTARSLAAGRRIANDSAPATLCDALLPPMPGEMTFAINRDLVADGFAITDDEALHAMAVAFEGFRLVLEPGGAVALAAVLSGKLKLEGGTAVAVCSGGNVDLPVLMQALQRFPDPLA